MTPAKVIEGTCGKASENNRTDVLHSQYRGVKLILEWMNRRSSTRKFELQPKKKKEKKKEKKKKEKKKREQKKMDRFLRCWKHSVHQFRWRRMWQTRRHKSHTNTIPPIIGIHETPSTSTSLVQTLITTRAVSLSDSSRGDIVFYHTLRFNLTGRLDGNDVSRPAKNSRTYSSDIFSISANLVEILNAVWAICKSECGNGYIVSICGIVSINSGALNMAVAMSPKTC